MDEVFLNVNMRGVLLINNLEFLSKIQTTKIEFIQLRNLSVYTLLF